MIEKTREAIEKPKRVLSEQVDFAPIILGAGF